jgi:hypothetical protein
MCSIDGIIEWGKGVERQEDIVSMLKETLLPKVPLAILYSTL